MRRIGDDSWLRPLWEATAAEWIQFVAALIGLLVLIWASIRIRAWYRDDSGPAANDQQMLTQIGDLHRQGDLSEAEYRSIKNRLLKRLDHSAPEPTTPAGNDEER